MTRLLAAGALALALVAVPGCGGSSSPDPSSQRTERKADGDKDGDKDAGKDAAADTSTCVAKATPVSGALPANYPRDFPLPQGAVLFNVEDRGADGVIGTAIVRASLTQVLAALNGPAQDAGFTVTDGETETHDAEANWEGNGYRGRWAIRDSANCPGEVVVQVLAKKQS